MTDIFVQFPYVNRDKNSFKHATLNIVCHVPSASIRKSLQQSCQHIQNEVQRAKVATAINTYLLTYSMVQSPSWEANWFAASQEIPRISRNPKVHYRTHKHPPPVPILGQPYPHIPPPGDPS